MKGKFLLLAGAAVGYVMGTRAGRERYEQIKASVTKAWNDPRVQEKVAGAEQFVSERGPQLQEKLNAAAGAAKSRFGKDEATSVTTDPTASDEHLQPQDGAA